MTEINLHPVDKLLIDGYPLYVHDELSKINIQQIYEDILIKEEYNLTALINLITLTLLHIELRGKHYAETITLAYYGESLRKEQCILSKTQLLHSVYLASRCIKNANGSPINKLYGLYM